MQPLRRGDTGPAVVEIRRMLSQFGLLATRPTALRITSIPSSSTPCAPSSSGVG